MNEPEQTAIPLGQHREIRFIEESVIKRLKSELEALNFTVRESGRQNQLIAADCKIDPGQLTRILNGEQHFPMNKRGHLYRACGNYALLQYLNYSEGFENEPRKRKSELELQLEATRRQLEEEQIKNRVLTEAIGGGR